MGRGNALPRGFFGAVHAASGVPRNNVLAVGACTLVGVFLLTYQRGAELLNFGAFIAFMGVNAAALFHYRFRSQQRVFLAATIPTLGLLVSGFIWLNLNHSAQFLGIIWIGVGLLLYFVMRRNASADSVEPRFD
jgi:amino acid transporter